jgi:hypothetical protein
MFPVLEIYECKLNYSFCLDNQGFAYTQTHTHSQSLLLKHIHTHTHISLSFFIENFIQHLNNYDYQYIKMSTHTTNSEYHVKIIMKHSDFCVSRGRP